MNQPKCLFKTFHITTDGLGGIQTLAVAMIPHNCVCVCVFCYVPYFELLLLADTVISFLTRGTGKWRLLVKMYNAVLREMLLFSTPEVSTD